MVKVRIDEEPPICIQDKEGIIDVFVYFHDDINSPDVIINKEEATILANKIKGVCENCCELYNKNKQALLKSLEEELK